MVSLGEQIENTLRNTSIPVAKRLEEFEKARAEIESSGSEADKEHLKKLVDLMVKKSQWRLNRSFAAKNNSELIKAKSISKAVQRVTKSKVLRNEILGTDLANNLRNLGL